MGAQSAGATGGGLSSSSAASSSSGDADGTSGSGNKIFNFGGNPNVNSANTTIANTLANPFIIIGVVLVVFLIKRKK